MIDLLITEGYPSATPHHTSSAAAVAAHHAAALRGPRSQCADRIRFDFFLFDNGWLDQDEEAFFIAYDDRPILKHPADNRDFGFILNLFRDCQFRSGNQECFFVYDHPMNRNIGDLHDGSSVCLVAFSMVLPLQNV